MVFIISIKPDFESFARFYFNSSGSVAYIGGSEHNITFTASKEVLHEGLAIKVGGDKNNIRLKNGNFPHQNDFKAHNFELNNQTSFPVVLSNKSQGVKVKSLGQVTDLGTGNKIEKLTK
ncbi:hypothetical protein LG651_06760 [Tamlana sp. 62-3]|uniref:Uncharacterized protein n=1 Tax=Neotamlana sargassicola TaxID=2883125 RepID=A0A9X1L7N9_9FLAO|nr:hypothetical protein [Tamlana sargassicola]MCB4807948.1 hypothetical protein [Tamlana sargassicola]